MLTGYRKKLVKETISYFIDTTGLTSDNFLLLVQRNSMKDEAVLNYTEWLAVKCFKMLKEHDVSLADCLEFRNLANQLKMEKRGINISPLWKKEIAKCINSTNVKDFTLCEISDSNSEFAYIDGAEFSVVDFEDDTVNFFNTFDFDRSNPTFLRLLPKNVRQAILYKSPLFINVNPYLEQNKNVENVLEDMRLHGFNKKTHKDMLFVALFRLMKLCEEYELTNVRIGFFGSLDMFCEKQEYLLFYKAFKEKFKFNTGLCFNPKIVGVKDKSEYIGYLIWDLKQGYEKDVPVVLEERIQHTDDVILKGSSRLFRGKRDSLYDWVSKGVSKQGKSYEVPVYLNIQTKSEEKVMRFENVLGYQQNTKNLLRSMKKVGIYNVPIGECTEITQENFLKSVASFTVRSCLMEEESYSMNPIYLSAPDVEIQGYHDWLADAIIYFTFGPLNMSKSYRELDFKQSNSFFPLPFSEVRRVVKDENIINDMNTSVATNLTFLNILDSCKANLSADGKNFYSFCNNKLIKSLSGKYRENEGYKDSLVAWDAGFYQVRGIAKLFTPKEEERYNYLLSKLKDKLREGVYKYGFVSDNN